MESNTSRSKQSTEEEVDEILPPVEAIREVRVRKTISVFHCFNQLLLAFDHEKYENNAIGGTDKTLIKQLNISRIWPVLLTKKFYLTAYNISLRFAAEAAAGMGSPLRKFLTLTIKNVADARNMSFRGRNNVTFTTNPQTVPQNDYFEIGHIKAVLLVKLGGGSCVSILPLCILPFYHPTRALFQTDQLPELEYFDSKKSL